jgi:lipopolysaccharide transport system permease protein
MSRREVIVRYQGSVMSLTWSFFNPVITGTVHACIFHYFKARLGTDGEDSKTLFVVVLFAGMIVHGVFLKYIIHRRA